MPKFEMNKADGRAVSGGNGDQSYASANSPDDLGIQPAIPGMLPRGNRDQLRADKLYDAFIVARLSPSNQVGYLPLFFRQKPKA
jgi:hypothetical protein